MSASEASRSFSAVLDSAEHRETIVITRSGQRVALVGPAPRTNGGAMRKVFSRWHDVDALDEQFAAHVDSGREAGTGELDADPWHG